MNLLVDGVSLPVYEWIYARLSYRAICLLEENDFDELRYWDYGFDTGLIVGRCERNYES